MKPLSTYSKFLKDRMMKFHPVSCFRSLYKHISVISSDELKYKALREKGHNIILGRGIDIFGTENINIGNDVHFMGRDYLDARGGSIVIGNQTSFNIGVILDASFDGKIVIGNNVMIGPNVVIIASSHIYSRTDIPMRNQGHIGGMITIEDDVWIGANSVITPGVVIKRGVIIGAGAVVTHDIDEFVIAGGVPAKSLGVRNL